MSYTIGTSIGNERIPEAESDKKLSWKELQDRKISLKRRACELEEEDIEVSKQKREVSSHNSLTPSIFDKSEDDKETNKYTEISNQKQAEEMMKIVDDELEALKEVFEKPIQQQEIKFK